MSTDANSREVRLARRALRTAQTHLRRAANRAAMPTATAEDCRRDAVALDDWADRLARYENEANRHLESKRRKRARRAA